MGRNGAWPSPLVVCLLVTVLSIAGCDEADGPGTPTAPPAPTESTLSGVVQPILTANCAFASCHAGTEPQMGMHLGDGQTFANTVNVSSTQVPRLFRVDPARVDSSYVLIKLRGLGGAVGGSPTKMPLGGSLTDAQIDTIRMWIADGARNN